MLTNTAILDPLTKTARSPKLDKKERFFRWCMWYRTEFDFIVLLIHLHTRKIPFNAPVFNNVTSHALFYGGHLVMRSKRCAVQNQGITLNVFLQYIIISNSLNFFLYDCVTLGDWVNGWSCKINGFSYEVHELRKGRFLFCPSLQTFCCCSLKRSWSIFKIQGPYRDQP